MRVFGFFLTANQLVVAGLDGDGNILYSGGPYIEGQDENTIFTQVMNINGSGDELFIHFIIEKGFSNPIKASYDSNAVGNDERPAGRAPSTGARQLRRSPG